MTQTPLSLAVAPKPKDLDLDSMAIYALGRCTPYGVRRGKQYYVSWLDYV